jgi:hypothetical protein
MKRFLIFLLLLAPVALPGLAHASPPDPTWIQGISDDDDGDSIVTLITSGAGRAPEATPTGLPLFAPLSARLSPAPGQTSLQVWASADPSRAPPAH